MSEAIDKYKTTEEKNNKLTRGHILYQIGCTLMQALRVASILENRLNTSFQYVEPTESNYNTYSLESRSIIVEACIQIEAIAQRFYHLTTNKTDKFSWKKFSKYIRSTDTIKIYGSNETTSSSILYLTNSYVLFKPFQSIMLFEYELIHLPPWLEAKEEKMPSWWNGYNKIKHNGNVDFSFCTYHKAIEAIAGLYLMIAFISFEMQYPLAKNTEFKPKFFYSKELDACFE